LKGFENGISFGKKVARYPRSGQKKGSLRKAAFLVYAAGAAINKLNINQ